MKFIQAIMINYPRKNNTTAMVSTDLHILCQSQFPRFPCFQAHRVFRLLFSRPHGCGVLHLLQYFCLYPGPTSTFCFSAREESAFVWRLGHHSRVLSLSYFAGGFASLLLFSRLDLKYRYVTAELHDNDESMQNRY